MRQEQDAAVEPLPGGEFMHALGQGDVQTAAQVGNHGLLFFVALF